MKERDDFEPSNSNSDLEPVASHSVCGNNAIGQMFKTIKILDSYELYRKATECAAFHSKLFPGAIPFDYRKGFEECGAWVLSLLNSEQKVQVSDTTEAKSMGEPLAQNNTPVKEDWKEELSNRFEHCFFGQNTSFKELTDFVANLINKPLNR